MNLSVIQQELINILQGFQAHLPLTKIIEKFPVKHINTRLPLIPYTAWELLDHMRIAQRDILDYIQSPDYKEQPFPEGYWPPKQKTVSAQDWNNSIEQFKKDQQALLKIIMDPQADLMAPLARHPRHTIFREICILGNHNSYHCGQLLIIKRLLSIA